MQGSSAHATTIEGPTPAWRSARRSGRGGRATRSAVVLLGAALATGGCGQERQDADEPRRDFRATATASFPSSQELASSEDLEITVRNLDTEAMPDVSVTLEGLYAELEDESTAQRIADPNRPVWVVEDQPQGAPVANDNTWTVGRLAPGAEKTFRWTFSPAMTGRWRLRYRVAAGVDGEALVRDDATGGPLRGTITTTIAAEPGQSRIDPETGQPAPAT